MSDERRISFDEFVREATRNIMEPIPRLVPGTPIRPLTVPSATFEVVLAPDPRDLCTQGGPWWER